jgi:sortase A
MKRVLELAGSSLVFIASAALLWCGAFLLRAHLEQTRASAILNREASIHSTDRRTVHDIQPHGPLGRIAIPRIGVSSVILEGDDKDTLALSVGHVPGTALPGSDGNVALAAHRDTFFRGLEHIRAGDDIKLTSIGSDRADRVESTRVVAPADVYVLKETGLPTLTLVTCYPFHYVGPAPKRFIVQAQLIRP